MMMMMKMNGWWMDDDYYDEWLWEKAEGNRCMKKEQNT
jgi:hypothetical protein